MPKKLSPEEWLDNVFSKLKADSVRGCWEWTGGLTSDGYGAMNYRGRGTKTHRALFIHLYGDLPEEIGVLHSCDNRKCCNPFHWFIGTQAKNVEDCVRKGRHRGAPGERQACHILTEKDVIRIRIMRLETGRRYSDIAKEFGVASITAQQAAVGYSWSHIKEHVVPKTGRWAKK